MSIIKPQTLFNLRRNFMSNIHRHPACNVHILLISRGQDVISWDLLAEIDFCVLSYSLTHCFPPKLDYF